jgi:cyclohexyl-isocyanide hydratase
MSLRFGLLVFPNIQQLDLTGPYEVFASSPDAVVDLIWKDRAPLFSSTRLALAPTMSFAECPPLDVLCIPGGGGVNPLLDDAEVLAFIREQASRARYVTAVCTGTLLLGAAGLLKGKRATTHWNAHDFLAHFGAIPVQDRIVRDGNLVTAGGVTSGIDFGLAVVAELLGREEAESIQLQLEYSPAPPFHAGTPNEAPPAVLQLTRERIGKSRAYREAWFARRDAESAATA